MKRYFERLWFRLFHRQHRYREVVLQDPDHPWMFSACRCGDVRTVPPLTKVPCTPAQAERLVRAAQKGKELKGPTCGRCKRTDSVWFTVPDSVWDAVVPKGWRKAVLCLRCFDGYAEAAGVTYAPQLTLYY